MWWTSFHLITNYFCGGLYFLVTLFLHLLLYSVFAVTQFLWELSKHNMQNFLQLQSNCEITKLCLVKPTQHLSGISVYCSSAEFVLLHLAFTWCIYVLYDALIYFIRQVRVEVVCVIACSCVTIVVALACGMCVCYLNVHVIFYSYHSQLLRHCQA